MSRSRILLILVVLLLNSTIVSAQGPSSEVTALGAAIDQRAAANGLPSGNGNVSSAEAAVADAIYGAVSEFNGLITEFEQGSAENSAWTESVEQTVQTYDDQIAAAQTEPNPDPRAQAISEAVAQYGQEIEQLQANAPADPRAQIISDAVAQYGQEPANSNTSNDPRAQAISDAVAQYGQEIESLTGHELTDQERQTVSQTVREGADDYIAGSNNINRRAINRRRINRLIEIMVPGQILPMNGNWRSLPYESSVSGSCLSLNTYGDGDTSGSIDELPTYPLCGYENPGSLPFITWQSESHPYLPGTSSIYSQSPSRRTELVLDASGTAVGSMTVTSTTEYEVVSPDLVHVHVTVVESGGCTREGDYFIELVTPDESVCAAAPPQEVEPTPEPTLPPEEVEGPYQVVGLPSILNPDQCSEANTPPQFTGLQLHLQTDDSIIIDYGSGAQVVYASGANAYEYRSGSAGDARLTISLHIGDDGTGRLAWSIRLPDGNNCRVDYSLARPGIEPEATATPEPTTSADDIISQVEAVSMVEGNYTVAWTVMDMLCPANLQPIAPTFTNVSITQADAQTVVVDFGTGQYTLTDPEGDLFYALTGAGEGINYAMNIYSSAPGTVALTWNGSPSASPDTPCIVMGNLTMTN